MVLIIVVRYHKTVMRASCAVQFLIHLVLC